MFRSDCSWSSAKTFLPYRGNVLISMGKLLNSGLGRLIVQISSSLTIRRTHTHTVELLSTSDQLVAEADTYTSHNKHKRPTPMPSTGFESTISAVEHFQTSRSPGSASDNVVNSEVSGTNLSTDAVLYPGIKLHCREQLKIAVFLL